MLIGALAVGVGLPLVGGAVLLVEDFEDNASGWTGSGNMSVSYTTLIASPSTPIGSMEGVFASQFLFLPQTGSFMIDSGTDFMGDYVTPGITGFTFDFMADTVLPMDLNLRLFSGSDVFFYTLNTASLLLDTWTSFSVPLTFSAGWVGNSLNFNSALASISTVQVQVARSGTLQQFYFLDNFGTTTNAFDLGGGEDVVPEPNTALLLFYGCALFYTSRLRKNWRGPGGEEAA